MRIFFLCLMSRDETNLIEKICLNTLNYAGNVIRFAFIILFVCKHNILCHWVNTNDITTNYVVAISGSKGCFRYIFVFNFNLVIS